MRGGLLVRDGMEGELQGRDGASRVGMMRAKATGMGTGTELARVVVWCNKMEDGVGIMEAQFLRWDGWIARP